MPRATRPLTVFWSISGKFEKSPGPVATTADAADFLETLVPSLDFDFFDFVSSPVSEMCKQKDGQMRAYLTR